LSDFQKKTHPPKNPQRGEKSRNLVALLAARFLITFLITFNPKVCYMKKARNNFYDSVGIGLLNVGSRYMWFPVKTEWQGRGVDVVDGLAVKTGPMVPAAKRS
jgi:hypothetical protein